MPTATWPRETGPEARALGGWWGEGEGWRTCGAPEAAEGDAVGAGEVDAEAGDAVEQEEA